MTCHKKNTKCEEIEYSTLCKLSNYLSKEFNIESWKIIRELKEFDGYTILYDWVLMEEHEGNNNGSYPAAVIKSKTREGAERELADRINRGELSDSQFFEHFVKVSEDSFDKLKKLQPTLTDECTNINQKIVHYLLVDDSDEFIWLAKSKN